MVRNLLESRGEEFRKPPGWDRLWGNRPVLLGYCCPRVPRFSSVFPRRRAGLVSFGAVALTIRARFSFLARFFLVTRLSLGAPYPPVRSQPRGSSLGYEAW